MFKEKKDINENICKYQETVRNYQIDFKESNKTSRNKNFNGKSYKCMGLIAVYTNLKK